jgi:hypothetical protein
VNRLDEQDARLQTTDPARWGGLSGNDG